MRKRAVFFQLKAQNAALTAQLRRAAVCGWLGAEPSGQKGKLSVYSLSSTARCARSPARGSFLCPLPCRARHDFEWPPLRSGHVQRNFYFKFSRLSRSAERDRRFFHRWGRSRKLHLQCLLPVEAQRCGRIPLPSAHCVRSHLPQGDGFRGEEKVCGSV